MLFVPADSEKKLSKVVDSSADVVILDLEDSVADARKSIARTSAAEFISHAAGRARPRLYVRINPLDTSEVMDDVAAVVVPGLDGIMLPKIGSAEDVRRLGYCLDALEARAGIAAGSVRIVPVATETPEAMLSLQSFTRSLPRLAGITWGAEDLSSAVGAVSNRDEDGAWSPLYQHANSLCLCAAAAAGVPAIDTLYVDFRDRAGLEADCRRSRRRGFRGRIAIHPDQVDVINSAYSPSSEEIAHARRIVELFAANPHAGTQSLDGKMIDRPHLVQALQTLGMT
jgi:citrate lyase subunit beta/citryl-CoA lyase